jgi:putative toxin-antitoxin system antitoxin component (TIGR02293 family)
MDTAQTLCGRTEDAMTVVSDILASDIVDTGDVAKVAHSSVRSVLRWQDPGTSPRRDTEERLLELKAVLDLARRVFGDETARLWLRSPVPALDYEKPLELVAAGQWREVIDVLLAFAEGVTA